jgi:hypothetical protein
MNFEYDIFISYSPYIKEGDEGISNWTTKFCEYLAIMISRLTDQEPTILLHDDLRTRKELLGNNKTNIFLKTAVFVTIITPEDAQSKEYISELEDIHKLINGKSANTSGKTNRFFKVLTQPINEGTLPDFLMNEISYEFYEINRYNKKAKTYSIDEEDETFTKFWSILVDLAYDIYNSLHSLAYKGEEDIIRPREKKFIYLAETTADQKDNRDILRRELQYQGYGVLPFIQLPDDADKLTGMVESYLEKSILSVHLMGSYYGDYVKNSKYSLIDFQNQTVKSYIDKSDKAAMLIRMIWIPSDLKTSDQRQSLYLKRLKRDEAQEKTEIIEAPLEVFKSILNDKLEEIDKPPATSEIKARKKIYLIYENNERQHVMNIIKDIDEKDFSVLDIAGDASKKNLVSRHINNLIEADAVVIYNGNSGKQWLESKIRDLIKTPGYGKVNHFLAIGIISDQKLDKNITNYLSDYDIVMDKEISSAFLKRFLETIKTNNGKRS